MGKSKELVTLVKQGFIHVLAGNTIGKMLSFISGIVIVRLVSKVDYANLSYADNIYLYLSMISGFGMASGVLKYCVSDKRDRNKAFLRYALKCGTAIQIVLGAGIWIIGEEVDFPFLGIKILIQISVLLPFLSYLFSLFQSYARSQLNNNIYINSSLIQAIVVLILSMILVLCIGIKGVIFARYLAVIAGIIYFVPFLKKEQINKYEYTLDRKEKVDFWKLSLSICIASFFSTIIPANESFFINNIIADEFITANYRVANLLPSQLVFVSNSIVIYFFPLIAAMDDKKKIWRKLEKIGVFSAFFLGGLTLLGAIFTPLIISIFYGESYIDATTLSYIMWIVYFFNAGIRVIPMSFLPALGITRFNVWLSVGSCGIHAVLEYILISKYGLQGAMVTTAVIYLFTGIIYWRYLYKICKGG